MSWCPKCKLEYRSGFAVCSECECDLVDELEVESPKEIDFNGEEVLLVYVPDNIFATMLEGALQSVGIPSRRKYGNEGQIFNVSSGTFDSYDIYIYVPKGCYQDAIQVVQELNVTDGDNELDIRDEEEYFEIMKRKRNRMKWLLVTFVVGPMLILMAAVIMDYFIGVFK